MIPLRLKLSPARLSQAFTLIEISVAIAVGSIVLAAVATLTMYAAKASLALVNYTDLDSKSRYALDVRWSCLKPVKAT